jgi:hypothetical protein
MKNWKQLNVMAIIAIVGIIMGFTACDKDNGTTHTHEWVWRVTTPATHETEGVETETCATCGQTNGTRTIARIPFTSVDSLETWLTSKQANTVDTPYKVALKIDDVNDFESLNTLLYSEQNKYVYLDLSVSTVTTIPQSAFAGEDGKGCATLVGITIPNSVNSVRTPLLTSTLWYSLLL